MEIALNGLHTRVTLETSNKRILYAPTFTAYLYNRCVIHHTRLISFFHFFQNMWHRLYNSKFKKKAKIRSRDRKKKRSYNTKLLTSKATSTAWVWILWASSHETCSKLFSVSAPFSMVTSAKDFIHCIHGCSSSQLWPAGKIYETRPSST